MNKQVYIRYSTETEAELFAEMPFDLLYVRMGDEPELVPEHVGDVYKCDDGWYVWDRFNNDDRPHFGQVVGPFTSALRAAKVVQRTVKRVWH